MFDPSLQPEAKLLLAHSHALNQRLELLIERITESCVRNDTLLLAFAKERGAANALGPINDLRWDNKVFGSDLLAQTADRAEG